MDFRNELGSSESCSQRSDIEFNSTGITNLKNIENENKLTFKHKMVRGELQSDYYETNPKQVINNKDEHDPIQNQFNSQCFKEHDMVRAELQCEDPLLFNTDFVSWPHFKNDYELGNSEKISNHVTIMPDEMAVHSENTKDKCPKSIPAFLRYQDFDSSVSSRNLKVCNHTDILEKEKNDHVISLHEAKRKEEENKQSSSGIRKDFTPRCNSEDNRALKVSQRGNEVELKSRKQKQTNRNPCIGTDLSESFLTSSSLSHPQQPTVYAEDTEYKNPGKVLMRKSMPKHPDYEPLRSQINSFTGWPTYLDQTPQIIAEAGFYTGRQETIIEQELLPPDEGSGSRPRRQSNSASSSATKEDFIKMRRLVTVIEDNSPLPLTTGIPQTTTESNQSRLNISNPTNSTVNLTSIPLFGNHGASQNTKAAKSPSALPRLEIATLPQLDEKSLKKEWLRDWNTCRICKDSDRELRILTCCHLQCCEVCLKALGFCPFCKATLIKL